MTGAVERGVNSVVPANSDPDLKQAASNTQLITANAAGTCLAL